MPAAFRQADENESAWTPKCRSRRQPGLTVCVRLYRKSFAGGWPRSAGRATSGSENGGDRENCGGQHGGPSRWDRHIGNGWAVSRQLVSTLNQEWFGLPDDPGEQRSCGTTKLGAFRQEQVMDG